MSSSVCNQFFHYKWFEKLNCHLFWQTALINLKFRSYDDYRTSGIVNTLTKKVLTKTSLFTFKHIRQ